MGDDRKWTDDQLRNAVATSRTYRQVMRAIGLAAGSLVYLKKQIARLALDTSHFDSHPKNPLASDDELREIVRSSTTGTEVLARLGMQPRRAHFEKLNRRLAQLALDTSHFRSARGRRRSRWTDEQLRDAVRASTSYRGVIEKLGLIAAGGNYDQVKRRIAELALDTSHFQGYGWSRGKQLPYAPKVPLCEVLVAGRWTMSHPLKKRLFREGLKQPKCERCGWCERAPDGRIPVELDHINGDKNDNRLENLRILCPNCHSLQPTHRGLNQKSRLKPAAR